MDFYALTLSAKVNELYQRTIYINKINMIDQPLPPTHKTILPRETTESLSTRETTPMRSGLG